MGKEGVIARLRAAYGGRVSSARTRRAMHAALAVAIVAPPLALAVLAYARVRADATEMVLARRRAVAQMGAAAVRERLDHLTTLGRSLAGRVRFRSLIAEGRWREAVAILEGVPREFRDVERVFLADRAGVERADAPPLPGAVGKSFAHRDWYRGVTATWRPYVSEPYRRTAAPPRYVIAVAIPIESAAGARLGILVLQVKLDSFRRWSREVMLEDAGFVYFVDRRGRVIAHPDVPAQAPIVDVSHAALVRRVIAGERGVLVGDDPLRPGAHVSAFEPVADYGWGVVASQATPLAFATRQRALRSVLVMGGLVLLIAAIAAYAAIAALDTLRLATTRQAELVRTRTELEQMKLFNFVASHDLQEPLHKLTLFADVLAREHADALGTEGRARLAILVDAAARMRALVEQMLQLARVATRGREPVPVALDDVLASVRAEHAPTIAATGAEVELAPLPTVLADRAQMETLFRNLLGNALKFRRPGESPHVRVACVGRNGDRCEVAVEDHGIGFDERHATRIFEPFRRLHPRHAYEGSGLGLAICHRIVQRHKGSLRARSMPGEGSTFVVTLPTAPPREGRSDGRA